MRTQIRVSTLWKKRFILFVVMLFTTITWVASAAYRGRYLNGDEPKRTQTRNAGQFMSKITGEFDVKIVPLDIGDSQIGMMLLDKSYRGELQATGKGRMLTGMTSVKESAAYVAIERIEGELNGKKGSFLVQHSGTMTKEKQSLSINVVPDSGTDELVGLQGNMQIRIVERKHYYDFEFALPEAK